MNTSYKNCGPQTVADQAGGGGGGSLECSSTVLSVGSGRGVARALAMATYREDDGHYGDGESPLPPLLPMAHDSQL